MSALTRDELRALREKSKAEFQRRRAETKETQITVGMGTCGMAAGARETLEAIGTELRKAGVEGVILRRTGCMGLCHSEPTVEVVVPGVPRVVYGKVTPDVGRKIVHDHVVNKQMVSGHIYDRPAGDILSSE